MAVFLTMLAVGMVLGFVGAGGSGFIIAILTVVFGFPIQTAFGTSLAAMVFTTLSGTYSHYREGNIAVKTGVFTGLLGAVGAFAGTRLAELFPRHDLTWFTAGMLFLSALLLWLRIFLMARLRQKPPRVHSGVRFWLSAAIIGLVTGTLSGTFGIGSTPFIQIGLLTFLGLTIRQSAGTTMLVILPIALAGGLGYYSLGHLDLKLLVEVVAGTMLGSYVGAKFTARVPQPILKTAMVAVPILGGLVMLL
ncbi:sulfite exporter TauE/SafE family protein [Alicyclobacillus tolerans]|uniref:sulfite exporter TauE/SafE family protein n=1 Tax=Alicyclobacillus tolerans TaxID=90970 RepID=UPI001F44F1AC|nr:sulfite exporter TauE/SafE family protein [Alicyclobacillus tolerans]MCF8565011.1 sulfite exporter TauE/SafE family protein [Alicyclobacillus tolerans]